MNRVYAMGGIGVGGHWYGRLHTFLREWIVLHRAAGLKTYPQREKLLSDYGVPSQRYHQVLPGQSLPDSFFDGIDVAYIASHNQYHAAQVRQCVDHAKPVVVEKALATNETEFNQLLEYIRSKGLEHNVLVHLHYLDKAPTLELKNKLLPRLLAEQGRVTAAAATFLEAASEEDSHRTWLLRPENGGITLDWTHAGAILTQVVGARFDQCTSAQGYIVRPEYDQVHPTAVEAAYALSGDHLVPGAKAVVRVGKGFPEGSSFKGMRLQFESGANLDLIYPGTHDEVRGSGGRWRVHKNGQTVQEGTPTPKPSYELFAQQMVGMLEGTQLPPSHAELEQIYRPVWLTHQKLAGQKPLTTGWNELYARGEQLQIA